MLIQRLVNLPKSHMCIRLFFPQGNRRAKTIIKYVLIDFSKDDWINSSFQIYQRNVMNNIKDELKELRMQPKHNKFQFKF